MQRISLEAVLVPPAKGSTAILPGTSRGVLPDEVLELEPEEDDPMLKDPTALLVLESSCVFVLVPPLLPVLEEVLQRSLLSFHFLSVSFCLDSTFSIGLRSKLSMATQCHMLPGHLFRACERHLALVACAVLNSEASTIMHDEV